MIFLKQVLEKYVTNFAVLLSIYNSRTLTAFYIFHSLPVRNFTDTQEFIALFLSLQNFDQNTNPTFLILRVYKYYYCQSYLLLLL